MSLGETIYRLRTEKNLSQGDLAERLDVSRQSISKWENNSAIPDLEKIIKLSEIFDVSLDLLVKGNTEQQSKISIQENMPKSKRRSNKLISHRDVIVLITLPILAVLILLVQKFFTPTSGELYQKGLDVISLMVEAARCEGYVELNTGDSAIREAIQDIGAGNYASPKAVYAVTVDDESLWKYAEWKDYDISSDEFRKNTRDKILKSLITQLNSASTVERIVAGTICSEEISFVNKNVKNSVIYIYTYESAMPVSVAFIVGEAGAISAKGNFIMYDEITYSSVEDIKACFDGLDVKVEQVQ